MVINWGFVFSVVNFFLFVVALYWLLRRPLQTHFAARAHDLEVALAEARGAEQTAQRRLDEIQKQLAQSEHAITELKAQMRADGELDRQAMVAKAHEMAKKLELDTERMIVQELRKNKETLRGTTVDMAILMAERLLREQLTTEDQFRLVRDYVQRLGSLH
ncbi:MAG: ATP synthase F0 subunit B [Deltaproteobacteria bacterium]|nr:ATP synthase F0 subunit B [Deltaproteobacteria bacterium]